MYFSICLSVSVFLYLSVFVYLCLSLFVCLCLSLSVYVFLYLFVCVCPPCTICNCAAEIFYLISALWVELDRYIGSTHNRGRLWDSRQSMTIGDTSMPIFQDEDTHRIHRDMSSIGHPCSTIQGSAGYLSLKKQAVVLLPCWTNNIRTIYLMFHKPNFYVCFAY